MITIGACINIHVFVALTNISFSFMLSFSPLIIIIVITIIIIISFPDLLPLAYESLHEHGVHDLAVIGIVLAVPICIGLLFVSFIELFVVPEKHIHQD